MRLTLGFLGSVGRWLRLLRMRPVCFLSAPDWLITSCRSGGGFIRLPHLLIFWLTCCGIVVVARRYLNKVKPLTLPSFLHLIWVPLFPLLLFNHATLGSLHADIIFMCIGFIHRLSSILVQSGGYPGEVPVLSLYNGGTSCLVCTFCHHWCLYPHGKRPYLFI